MTRALVWPVAVVFGFSSSAAAKASGASPAQPNPVAVTFVGQVVDSRTNSPICYGIVRVGNTQFRTNVDTGGAYHLAATLAPGDYVLDVLAIGFQRAHHPVVVRDSGEIRVPKFSLEESAIRLDDLIVPGPVCKPITRRPRRLPKGASVQSSRDSTGKESLVLCTNPR